MFFLPPSLSSVPPSLSTSLRTYHLVIRGLLNAGEEKKAVEVADKAPLALADSTQEMLKTAVEAEAAVEKKEAEQQAQGEGEKKKEE